MAKQQSDRAQRVTLETLYNAESGSVFITGIQALVRLPLMQRRMDRHLGLNTAGLISGYRGSPVGAYDQQLWKAQRYLDEHDVVFQPGLNEDLAATALWGAQMHKAFGPTKRDGVFGIWFGKGNGVDRTGDAFRNANMLGTSKLGGVLAVGGDDHAAQSSMFPHQTDGIFQSVMMPVLQPASVDEILTLGMAGIALSRFSGLWVALKTIAEVVESAATFDLPDPYPRYSAPAHLVPPHGLNWDPTIQWPAERAEYERRVVEERIPAAIGWAISNRIDAPIFESMAARLCIVTVGKAHQDLMQALQDLSVSEHEAKSLGLSIYKVAMSWPLAADPLLSFAEGVDEILVVEEKAPIVESQIKNALFNRQGKRIRVTGKTDEDGKPLLPVVMEFSARIVAEALVRRIDWDTIGLAARLQVMRAAADTARVVPFPQRKPFFCSGCPHNSSTKTPEGSISGGGIGCHVMALSVPKLKTATFSQMGGEGMQWVGASPFSWTDHIFQNLGDGTYQHSGLLAVRAAVAANANVTFKILFNDAVAMTGGQPTEGLLEPRRIIAQLHAEGVTTVRLVTDDPARWRALPAGATVVHRDDLDRVQRELRDIPGVTAIVYEQTCAAEKRRRRKRNAMPDPDRRLFINPRVCEGCGDCSAQSNCISVQPLPTGEGTKRAIDQSACNKDFSCVKGFCPSFVEVEGPVLRKPDPAKIAAIEAARFAELPEPTPLSLSGQPYNIYVAGIGGLGVLTIGALLGAAAHHDERRATVLDFTGLAQKNGAVISQIRISNSSDPIHAVRIGLGEIDLMIGTDIVAASSPDALRKFGPGRGAIVLNTNETPTAEVVLDRDATLPTERMIATLLERAQKQGFTLNATRIAEGLFGNNVAANVLLVGYAWQKGLLPISAKAFEAAIEANGAAVNLNKRAFTWGRVAALDLDEVNRISGAVKSAAIDNDGGDSTDRRIADLIAYQDAHYAGRYSRLLCKVREAARAFGDKGDRLVEAVGSNAYKLMAYKDEYEVARLYTEPAFWAAFGAQFADARKLSVYLAPPLLSRLDPRTGRPAKRKFGPWIFRAMTLLAKGKQLRGTWADPFGRTAERRAERALRDEYISDVERLCSELSSETIDAVIAIAALPQMVRGFGPVKDAAMAQYRAERAALFHKLALHSEHQLAA